MLSGDFVLPRPFVEKPSDEDFVCPPLPPPPSEEDLASYNMSSVEHQTHSVVSPTYKAPGKYNVWTPSSKNTDDATAEVTTKPVKSTTAPAGFRSVAKPVFKIPSLADPALLKISLLGLNSNCNNNKARITMEQPASNYIDKNVNLHKSTANITLNCEKNKELHLNCNGSTPSYQPSLSCVENSNKLQQTDRKQLVTLLRDTRRILIKPEKGPIKSTVTTSYTVPNQAFPQPSENVRVTPKHELPEGAVYETQTIEDGLIHTDTYYPTPGEKTVLERTKKTTVFKAEHHHGFGPTDDQGVPVALRSTVDNPKAWYKNMFKQIHKLDQEDGDNGSNISQDDPEEKPVVSQAATYKPMKLGRITDYTPSEPYVVENKPIKSYADYSVWRGKKSWGKGCDIPSQNSSDKPNGIQKPIWVLEREEQDNRIPISSTSYKPSRNQESEKVESKSADEPVHGTDYSKMENYTMADYVVTEPKHVVTMHHTKPKQQVQTMRQPAKAKFDFTASTNKQLGLKKDQVVIITREINKDWYEGETPDGKKSGMFPVSYVEVLNQSSSRPVRRGVAKARFDFKSTSPKQLSVKKGDSVELIEKVDKNWYKGSVGQRIGILPANYIEVVREPEEKPKAGQLNSTANKSGDTAAKAQNSNQYFHKASNSSSSSEPDDKEKMSKASFLAHAVVNSGSQLSKPHARKGEFHIPELDDEAMGINSKMNGKTHHASQESSDTTLSTTSSSLHSDLGQNLHISNPATPTSSEGPQAPPPSTQSEQFDDDAFPVREKHVALYAYVPQNEDELELVGGDVVQVVEKCDDGWFVGTCERTGAFGTFPGNYVVSTD